MIKISAISYLNTKPFVYGLFKSGLDREVDLSFDIPSACAQKVISGEVDLGLIPVAKIPEVPNAHIISDYCIGTLGTVKTVSLYGTQPLSTWDTVYLDFHSRTSAALTQLLLRDYWAHPVTFKPAFPGFIDHIGGTTGGLVIGDRTIGLDFDFQYDLGEAWHDHTGLPFVFAAWVSNKALPTSFIDSFQQALQLGLESIDQLLELIPAPHPSFSLRDYYERYISYTLDAPKREALALFLSQISAEHRTPLLVPTPHS